MSKTAVDRFDIESTKTTAVSPVKTTLEVVNIKKANDCKVIMNNILDQLRVAEVLHRDFIEIRFSFEQVEVIAEAIGLLEGINR